MIGVRRSGDSLGSPTLDIDRFLAARGNRVHPFGSPASAADVRDAAFDKGEYRELRHCRPGHCKFKLPASAMKGFVEQVDWSAHDAKAHADERLRDGGDAAGHKREGASDCPRRPPA